MRSLALFATLTSCYSPQALERSSLKHRQKAEVLSQQGKGVAAQKEMLRAQSLEETARMRSERRSTWIWSDIMLE